MTQALTIYAGPSALKIIQKDGINAEHVKAFVGASGGPKWFVLYGLDQYLFGDFFFNKKSKLHTIGSSAGAWRMACLAQKRPVSAISRLAQKYSVETYSDKPTPQEITKKARIMLDYVFDANGCSDIINNNKVQTHLVAALSKGLVASEQPLKQGAGLLVSAAANAISRNNLKHFYERTVFHSGVNEKPFFRFEDLPTTHISLTSENLKEVLMASGSIPMVLEGVKNIPGAPAGVYRDGGIVDYHFDFRFNLGKELVLYPHFSRKIIPGWFDKGLPWRKIHPYHYENVVVLTPSKGFVSELPFSKISDRTDFKKMDPETRKKYWQTILSESQKLAVEFKRLVETGEGIDKILPLFPD